MTTGVQVQFPDAGVLQAIWPNLANTESGDWVDAGRFKDMAIQVSGTFGAGGTVIMEGSVDKAVAAPLNDPLGNPISITTAGAIQILENMRFLRPRVTAGDGTTDLKISLRGKGD